MSTLSDEDVKKLKALTESISANPDLLKLPQLECVKRMIERFGGKIPISTTKATPSPEPQKMDADFFEESDEEESEMSDIPGVNEGVIAPDEAIDQPMGDSSKTPTEEEMDQATDYRSKAASAYSEQKYQEAIDLYTKAIELNPGTALFHAKRGQAFLKLQKPNACIRDCDKALEINCDSAAAYKFRGRAHRLLGNWESAAKDLRQACKIDFDEEADEWLREVNPIAKKIEQHRIAKERKQADRERKKREKAAAAARKAREEAAKEQKASGGGAGAGAGAGAGGFPGGFPGGFNLPGGMGGNVLNDLLSGMGDPEVAEALKDIKNNPQNIGKYANNPKIAKLIDLVKNSFPGGMPGGFPGAAGGFPGAPGGFPGFPGFPGADPDSTTGEPTPPQSDSKPDSKKNFADDGLD